MSAPDFGEELAKMNGMFERLLKERDALLAENARLMARLAGPRLQLEQMLVQYAAARDWERLSATELAVRALR